MIRLERLGEKMGKGKFLAKAVSLKDVFCLKQSCQFLVKKVLSVNKKLVI